MYTCLIMLRMPTSPSNGMASGESTCGSMETAKSTQSGCPRESSVWDYFIYDGEKKSICQIGLDQEGSPPCSTEIAGKYTTNLKAHLKAKHPRKLAELAQKDVEKEDQRIEEKVAGWGIFQRNCPADYSQCSCPHEEVHSGK